MKLCVYMVLKYSGAISYCDAVNDPFNGNVYISGNNDHKTAVYKCYSGYKIKGNDYRTCKSGFWKGSPPVCVKDGKRLNVYLYNIIEVSLFAIRFSWQTQVVAHYPLAQILITSTIAIYSFLIHFRNLKIILLF